MFGKAAVMAAFAAAAGYAAACGVCIEDKVAAVYDHALVQQAFASGQVVVFCELKGTRQGAELAQQARRAAQALRGVQAGSVRTSDELPALSFTLAPAAQTPAAAVDALRTRLAPAGVEPVLLKVMRAPAPA